jgi:hypothetical protein
MKSLPRPALVAAVAALPFSFAASGTLFFTAALGCIIHADYVQRLQRVRLPRLAAKPDSSDTRSTFGRETHQLAA